MLLFNFDIFVSTPLPQTFALIIYRFLFATGHKLFKSFKRQSLFVSTLFFPFVPAVFCKKVFLQIIQNSKETLVQDSQFN